jgi:hypothetical protein
MFGWGELELVMKGEYSSGFSVVQLAGRVYSRRRRGKSGRRRS